jgi:hypothetical protein
VLDRRAFGTAIDIDYGKVGTSSESALIGAAMDRLNTPMGPLRKRDEARMVVRN